MSDPLDHVPRYERATSFHARRPRHEPGPASARTIYLAGGAADWHDAQLLDVSRAGIKLGSDESLAKGTRVQVVVQTADSTSLLDCTCVVRWCKREGDEIRPWHLGVEFPEPLEWETLGELFLHGVLNTGA